MSKEDIERMVNDAEKYRTEDESQREKVVAKNSLESYCFNVKSTVEDDKVKDKIDPADKKKILDKCGEIISWLDQNQLAEKEEFADKQKELETICNPVMTKLYQGGAGGVPGGPTAGATPGGPTIEEVD